MKGLFDVTDDDPMSDYGRVIAREQRRQTPGMIEPGYYMVRARKGFPPLPAKIWWSDHEPGNPDNLLERPVLMAEVAGDDADPIGVHAAIEGPLRSIDNLSIEATYRFRLDEIRWARAHASTDPAARHQRRVDLTFLDPIAPPPKRR